MSGCGSGCAVHERYQDRREIVPHVHEGTQEVVEHGMIRTSKPKTNSYRLALEIQREYNASRLLHNIIGLAIGLMCISYICMIGNGIIDSSKN